MRRTKSSRSCWGRVRERAEGFGKQGKAVVLTTAVLVWQAAIFFSIGLAGRWRWWVVAGWIAWTILQVVVLPLSVVQFGSIALAMMVFGRPRPSVLTATPNLELPQRRPTVSVDPPPMPSTPVSPVLNAINEWACDLEVRTKAWAEETIEHNRHTMSAREHIKTESFESPLEEAVMRDALAEDQRLTREIEAELAKDPILGELFRCALAARPASDGPRILMRQLSEKMALKSARAFREELETLVSGGEAYRNAYYDAMKRTAVVLPSNPSERNGEEYRMRYGRRIEEWVADVGASKRQRDL